MPDRTQGRRVAARYVLEERLGRGGMAEVWRARDERLQRDVAIKFLHVGAVSDAELAARSQREGQLLAAMNHPNVVAVHDVGEDEGEQYLVMEFVSGPSLQEVLREEGQLEPDRAVTVAAQVCQALAAAHERGVVHRDVKPSNVLFDPAGNVKLADFGVAKHLDASTTGTRYGSAPYVAPEQAEGGTVDHRADIYGLGCVLYEMLTGAPPFTGDAPAAIVYQHVHGQPEAPSNVRGELPEELDVVVLRALAKEPGQRHGSAESFQRALEDALAGVSRERTQVLDAPAAAAVTAPVGSSGARPVATGGRKRALVALGAIALVALGALLVTSALDDQDAAAPERAGPAQQGEPEDAGQEAQPAPADADEEATDPVTPEEASREMIHTVLQGRSEGGITEKGADELLDKGEKILEKLEEGKYRDADKEIREAHKTLEEMEREGEITPAWSREVSAALDAIGRSLGTVPGEGEGEGEEEDDDDD